MGGGKVRGKKEEGRSVKHELWGKKQVGSMRYVVCRGEGMRKL